MKLKDLLNVIEDDEEIVLYDRDGWWIVEYDNKQKVDEQYMNCDVIHTHAMYNDCFGITIDHDGIVG